MADPAATTQPTDEAMAAVKILNIYTDIPPSPDEAARIIDWHTRLPELKRENRRRFKALKAANALCQHIEQNFDHSKTDTWNFVEAWALIRAALADTEGAT